MMMIANSIAPIGALLIVLTPSVGYAQRDPFSDVEEEMSAAGLKPPETIREALRKFGLGGDASTCFESSRNFDRRIVIVYAPPDTAPQALHLSVRGNGAVIEKITLSGRGSSDWGGVSTRDAFSIRSSDELKMKIDSIIGDNKFWSAFNEAESAYASFIADESIWIFDACDGSRRRSIRLRSIETLNTLRLNDTRVRDFSPYIRIFDYLSELLASSAAANDANRGGSRKEAKEESVNTN